MLNSQDFQQCIIDLDRLEMMWYQTALSAGMLTFQ